MRGKVIFIDIDGPLSWGSWGDGEVKIMEGTKHEFTIPYAWDVADCGWQCCYRCWHQRVD